MCSGLLNCLKSSRCPASQICIHMLKWNTTSGSQKGSRHCQGCHPAVLHVYPSCHLWWVTGKLQIHHELDATKKLSVLTLHYPSWSWLLEIQQKGSYWEECEGNNKHHLEAPASEAGTGTVGQGCYEAGGLNKMLHVPTKVGKIFRAVLSVSTEDSPFFPCSSSFLKR